MNKLIILLLLCACTRSPNPNLEPNEEIIIEGDELNFSLTEDGISQETRNIGFPALNPGETAKVKVNITNITNSPKEVTFSNSLINFSVVSNCSLLKPRRSCSVVLTNIVKLAGVYEENLSINNENFLISLGINQQLNLNPNLRISNTDINLLIDNEVTLKKILLTNISSSNMPLLLEIPSGLEVYFSSCGSEIKARRTCAVELKVNKSALAPGANLKVVKVNNQEVKFNLTLENVSSCSGGSRKSASECDNLSVTSSLVKQILNTSLYPEAVCNDGSPAVFYFRPGTSSGANRWVIHLEEGGFCGKIPIYFGTTYLGEFNNCPNRQSTTPYLVSSTLAGTEAYYPFAYNYIEGILSKDKDKNPDFYTWNHVEIRYCSSDLWSGDMVRTISNQPFNFKGTKILDAVMNELKNTKNLSNATNIIISGSSAGGIGVINQVDRIKNTHLSNKDVVVLSDSGFLFNYPNPSGAPVFSKLFELNHPYFNAQPDSSCVARTNNPLSCHFGSTNHEDIETSKFLIQDQLDDFYLGVINQVDLCASTFSDSWINGYTATLRNSLNTETGVISLRYKQHVYINNQAWRLPLINGNLSISEVFSNWYFGKPGTKTFIQEDLGNIRDELTTLCN